MLTTVDFDSQFGVIAGGEIHDVAIDWDLSPEMDALFTQFPEMKPQLHFLLRHCFAKFEGSVTCHPTLLSVTPPGARAARRPPRQGEVWESLNNKKNRRARGPAAQSVCFRAFASWRAARSRPACRGRGGRPRSRRRPCRPR